MKKLSIKIRKYSVGLLLIGMLFVIAGWVCFDKLVAFSLVTLGCGVSLMVLTLVNAHFTDKHEESAHVAGKNE